MRIRFILLTLLIITTFAVGFISGKYQTFPHDFLLDSKRQLESLIHEKPPMSENKNAIRLGGHDAWLKGDAEIAMIGDSITANGRWSEMFPGTVVINRGINGDTIAGVRKRLGEILKHNPRTIFIMIGINDLFRENNIPDIIAEYREIAIELDGIPQVYFQSILHCGPPRCDDDRNRQISELNRKIAKLADDRGFVFVNLNAGMAKDGVIFPEITDDGIHLNGKGFQKWQSMLRPYIHIPKKPIQDK
jgi:lysophospholipase L1-like esterase/uncharacterized protein YneF (UPF0154 family)